MAARPTTLSLENLESRFNLSTLTGHLPLAGGGGVQAQERALFVKKTKVMSLGMGAERGLVFGEAAKRGEAALAARAGVDSPAPVVNVTSSTKAITVMWINNSTNVSGFKIERSTDGTTFAAVGTAGAGKTSFVDKTAVAGVEYFYRVTAFNKISATSSSDSKEVALTPVPPPAAPTGLTASKSTATSITLSWKDNASTESGFHLYRSTDGVAYTLVASLKANTKTYTDGGLKGGQMYYYELSAWSPTGEAYASIPFTASTTASVTTTQAAPGAPAGLAFSNVTGSGVTLSWSDTSTNVSGYRVYRSTDGKNFTLVGDVDNRTMSFSDTGLASTTGYAYEVAAWNDKASELSKIATVSTLQVAPAAPGNLTFSNLTSSSVTVGWTSHSTNQSGFAIYRSTDGAHFVAVATTGGGDSHYTDTNLTAGTTYYYKVAAGNSGGQGLSEAASVMTLAPTNTIETGPTTPTSAPGAPSGLGFTGVSNSAVTLHWTVAASGQTGLHVYRSTDGVNYTLVSTLGATVTSWTDTGVSASTGYVYEVGAFNVIGETRSSGADVLTLAASPTAPMNVNFTNVTASGATINWTPPAGGGQSGFRVYRSTDGTNFTLVSTAGASSTSWTDSGLASATAYSYEVSAYNAGGETRTAAAQTTTAALPVTTPAPVTGGAPTFAIKNMTSFSELVITATTGNDSIVVSQSGGTLVITANGASYSYANNFGDMKIYGVGGNDAITVNSSVNIATLIYGGDGNDTIINQTTGKATIVTIGNGVNSVTGNGVNTSYWVNSGDTVHSTSAETALGGVNRVSGFYNGVSRSLYGQNLTDPTDSGTEKRLTNSSLWGTGPSMNNIVQTGLADCYFLAPLASMAYSEPQKLMNMGVDLGDGTYAFRFVRGGTTTFVRVDGDLATGYWNYGLANATPSADGNEWGSLFEKAYAEFRSGANTYASLNWGAQSQTFYDLGVASSAIGPSGTSAAAMLSTINSNLSANHAVVASTNPTIKTGAPLIQSHVYSVIGAFNNSSGTLMIQLRNPWGVDGAGNDGNTSDAIVTVDYATFIANFGSLNYATA